VAEVRPLAHGRAQRARVASGRAVREEVGQVEEPRGAREGARELFGEPQQLRRLHLGRDDAADVAEHLVVRLVDAARLRLGAMVHPHDDVARVVARRAHAHGAVVRVEDDERAGRVEADSSNARGVRRIDAERSTDGLGSGAPDVVGRLLDDVGALAPRANGRDAEAAPRPRRVEQTGANAARADVHPQVKAVAHVVPRIRTRKPSSCESATISSKISPYATAT